MARPGILSALKLRFPRLAQFVRYRTGASKRKRSTFAGCSPQEVFTKIYDEEIWSATESRSGAGSTMAATELIRSELPRLVQDLGIRSMLDAPCGDYYWMRRVDLGLDQYIGGDIVESVIGSLQEEFGSSDSRRFIHIDLTKEPLPEVDALFCRDCLQHLDIHLAQQIIHNFARSSAQYLITTTFPDTKRNINEFTGGMNTINLTKPPFSLPEPMRTIPDHGSGDEVYRRCLGVWSRDQIPSR